MIDLGKHATFIWASYGIVVIVIGLLIAWLISEGNRLRRHLDELEASGEDRRSRR